MFLIPSGRPPEQAEVMNTASANGTGSTANSTHRPPSTPPLRRPADDRMIAGVAAGAARVVGIDPVVVRIAFVMLTLVGGVGVVLYLAGWLLIPDERSGRSVAADLFESAAAHHS
jgi:phage shock protein PspC (stress-responsive transcriptional regulator)